MALSNLSVRWSVFSLSAVMTRVHNGMLQFCCSNGLWRRPNIDQVMSCFYIEPGHILGCPTLLHYPLKAAVPLSEVPFLWFLLPSIWQQQSWSGLQGLPIAATILQQYVYSNWDQQYQVCLRKPAYVTVCCKQLTYVCNSTRPSSNVRVWYWD